MGHVFRRSSGRGWRLRQRSMALWPQWITQLQRFEPSLSLDTSLVQIAEDDAAFERMRRLASDRGHLGLQAIPPADVGTIWPTAQFGALQSKNDGRINPLLLQRALRLAPHAASLVDGLAPRIVPLRWVPEQEVHLYAMHRNLPLHHEECPNARGAMRWRHRDLVAQMEADTPGTRHSLLHMADQIKGLRVEIEQLGGRKNPPAQAKPCKICGNVTSGEQCKACDMRELLRNDLE